VWFYDFVGFVERPYRETQHHDAGNTEHVALLKQTRSTRLHRTDWSARLAKNFRTAWTVFRWIAKKIKCVNV
jgi:hypothetical protein